MNWDSDYGSSLLKSVYEQFNHYWPRNGRGPERNFKSDEQDIAMDKAQTRAEAADRLLKDAGPLEIEDIFHGSNEDRERFLHFVDPNGDAL